LSSIVCSNCNKTTSKFAGNLCLKCYQNKNAHFFYKDTKNKNPKELHKQRNVITSVEKVCSVCGKTFFSQGRKNHGKTCSVECRKKYYQLYFNTPEKKAQRKAYHLSHLKERQIYQKKKKLENPTFRLAHVLRSNMRINLLKLFKTNKDSSFEKMVGYSYADVRKHLESQFTEKMSWDNYGIFWEVDHIVPISWFKTKKQFLRKGWALSNLQPLERSLNCSKQNFYVGGFNSSKIIVLP
jgi:hypothetical protein